MEEKDSGPLRLLILGIPIDDVSTYGAVAAIQQMIARYHEDRRPRYVSTVNSDFLANALGWRSTHVRDPELLQTLRTSDLTTADGMPLVWLSRWLSPSLAERVTGADLVLRLASSLAAKKMSVYLLGGTEAVAQGAAHKLESSFSDLRITGVASPYLDIHGLELENSLERDALLLEQINAASPDVLLINLGNPKQELWFDRVKHQLKVPVSIGVGGTFSFLAGTLKRAPAWMQKYGLEWLYRLQQEPRRLLYRYVVDIAKFFYMAIPLVIYHRLNDWIYRLFPLREDALQYDKLFISPHKTVVTIGLPFSIDKSVVPSLFRRIDDAFDHDDLIFDFSRCRRVDLTGLALLAETWMRASREKKEVYGVGMRGDLRLLIKLHRIWDLLRHNQYAKPVEIVSRFLTDNNHSPLYEAVYQEKGFVVLSFLGRLDNHQDYEQYYEKYATFLHLKHCIVDLGYCTYIDNLGITFLMKLRKQLIYEGKTLRLAALSPELHRQFTLAGVSSLFAIYRTLEEAIRG
ncbi:MAG: WecB/TagA/CpsF family glycosyltransferase [Chlamydiales bacterium]|nr:WecB/TagA/CpsF family glycosyltransferase [Chlamydiia bacterium]MCP5507954.1 WecB/TagA/CpsF family glycosyltransferase [Chlamydiales bacterium]